MSAHNPLREESAPGIVIPGADGNPDFRDVVKAV